MKRVVSRQNPRLREVERLIGSSRDRRKSGRCVLEGAHLIGVYCKRFGAPDVLVVVDDQHDDDAIAASIAATAPADVLVVSRALFSEIATMPPDVGALAVVAAPTTERARAETRCRTGWKPSPTCSVVVRWESTSRRRFPTMERRSEGPRQAVEDGVGRDRGAFPARGHVGRAIRRESH